MSDHEADRYVVVRNDEEQYSIWPTGRLLPAGWTTVGSAGSREIALAYIEDVWTDMRPKSVRVAMDAQGDPHIR